jgi:hypothetical protein
MPLFKKKDIIKGINVGDIVTDNYNGEVIKVTYVNQSFIDGKVIDNFQPRDNFDTGDRQLSKSCIKELNKKK